MLHLGHETFNMWANIASMTMRKLKIEETSIEKLLEVKTIVSCECKLVMTQEVKMHSYTSDLQ